MEKEKTIMRVIKNNIFTDLFGQSKYALELYKSIHPEDCGITEDEITDITLKSIAVNGRYNDLGLLIRDRLIILVEAQSTWSVNILFRSLEYLVKTWRDFFSSKNESAYSTKPIQLPVPELYVIFTGNPNNIPDEISLKDEFWGGTDTAVNATIKVIKLDSSNGILEQYILFTKILDTQLREHENSVDAFRETIRICKDDNILREYLTDLERKEGYEMSIVLYDPEVELAEYIRCEKAQSFAEGETAGEARGEARGKAEGIAEGIAESQLSIARTLLAENLLEPEKIAEVTGLSIKDINKLA